MEVILNNSSHMGSGIILLQGQARAVLLKEKHNVRSNNLVPVSKSSDGTIQDDQLSSMSTCDPSSCHDSPSTLGFVLLNTSVGIAFTSTSVDSSPAIWSG